MKHSATLVTALFVLILASCTSITSSESKETQTSLKVVGQTASRNTTSITVEDKADNVFIIETAQLAIRDVEFETANDSSYKISGPFLVDLISGVSVPEIVTTSIPADEYKRVDVRVDDTDSDFNMVSQNDNIYSYSLYASGTIEGAPFQLRLKFNEDIRFDFATPIEIVEGEENSYQLHLHLTDWFALIDLSECIASANGSELIIEDTNNNCNDFENELKETIKNLYDLN